MTQINYNVDADVWNKNFPQYKKYISTTVDETLKVLDTHEAERVSVSFLLTSNQKIKILNSKYRNKDKSTNVLSFPMQLKHDENYILGDIVLASQILLKESLQQKVKKYDYLCKMTIHGMLHLLGYDHKTDKQFKQMNKYENLIFKTLKEKLK